jgi:hypothetical protein
MQFSTRFCRRLATSRAFELLIALIIIINAALIGIGTHGNHPAVQQAQRIHVGWLALSAFLLLNLLVGAIVNNYQVIMDETKRKHRAAASAQGSPPVACRPLLFPGASPAAKFR